MVNRNVGSGTRILIDQLLAGARPAGYAVQPGNHAAVVTAVAQQRADWGVAVAHAAAASGLGFVPLQQEQFDFVVPKTRLHRPALRVFCDLLGSAGMQTFLAGLADR